MDHKRLFSPLCSTVVNIIICNKWSSLYSLLRYFIQTGGETMRFKAILSDLGTITVDANSYEDAKTQALTWAKSVLKPSVIAVTEITIISGSIKCA